MARKSRIQSPGLVRHVMSRGNRRMEIFLDESDYRRFLYLLSDVLEDSRIRCWNYCLMPNHYHLTIEPTQPNLSLAIRRLNARYAQSWNRRHGTVGHLFQGRFKDQIVDRDEYLLVLSRYVVMNPVRARLVQNPEEWPWSSYRATLGVSSSPAFLAADATLQLFGEAELHVLRERFSSFVTAQPDDPCPVDRIRSDERVLGSQSFKDEVRLGVQ